MNISSNCSKFFYFEKAELCTESKWKKNYFYRIRVLSLHYIFIITTFLPKKSHMEYVQSIENSKQKNKYIQKFKWYGQLSFINNLVMAENKQASIHIISTSCPILFGIAVLSIPFFSFVSVCICISSYSMSISCYIVSTILFSLSHYEVD